MKILVAYYSNSGNTRKIAEAIFDSINCDKDLLDIKNINNIESYDLVFLGSPVLEFGVPKKICGFLEKNEAKIKKMAYFITHAMPTESKELLNILEQFKLLIDNKKMAGLFHCIGELDEKVSANMEKSDNPFLQNFGKMRFGTIGHPNKQDISNAIQFAKSIT